MNIDLNLFPYQKKAWDLTKKKKITVLLSGTGAGKTYFASPWIIVQTMMATENAMAYAVSADIPLLKKTIWRQIKITLKQWGLVKDVNYTINETDRVITFTHNNAQLYGVSANKDDSMQGGHIVAIAADEAGLYSAKAWHTIVQRASFNDAPILISSTPYTWNWIKELFDSWKEGNEPGVEFINVKSIENPMYPIEAYERAKKLLPRWKFLMLYHGLFTRPGNAVFQFDDDIEKAIHRKLTPLEIEAISSKADFAGIDWGFVHPAAIVWVTEVEGNFIVADCWRKKGKTIDQIVSYIKKQKTISRYARHYCDAANPGKIEYLKQAGIDAEKAEKKVDDGITLLQGLFNDKKLIIPKGLTPERQQRIDELWDEVVKYHWQTDKNNEAIEKPEKENDDLVDALRYALYTRIAQGNDQFFGFTTGKRRN